MKRNASDRKSGAPTNGKRPINGGVASTKNESGRRSATIQRRTKETKVTATLDLDGSGKYDVKTDNPFLTHMVETWTRYAGFDVKLRATGDLDHHLIEDVAITLGQAFKGAFRNAPCTRIAYDFVPMDDALVLCAVDLVDRPHYEGELPIPIWEHFFRSFAMEARINVHLEHLRGRDTHHTIEASVKAFARALRRALEPRASEISTKGVATLAGADAGAAGQRASEKRGKPGKAIVSRVSRVSRSPSLAARKRR